MFLSAVSCKWGWRMRRRLPGCGEGGGNDGQAPTGRAQGKRTGAPAGGLGCGLGCGLPGLEDYSARHAPRVSLRARRSWRSAGHLGVWLRFVRTAGVVCQQNHGMFGLGKTSGLPVRSFRTLKGRKQHCPSGAVRGVLTPKTVLFPAPG